MPENIFLINFINFLKSKKYRIGFVINGYPLPYDKITASTRIRVYDVIKMFFGDKKFLVELYNPLRKYDVVIFQKKFDKFALSQAKKLKAKRTKIILDINVNYYDSRSQFITEEQAKDIIAFTKLVDGVITPTAFLKETIKKLFPEKPVEIIGESIDEKFFREKKIYFKPNPINLIWSGYSPKASELLLIQKVLKEIYEKWPFNLNLICEKNPKLRIDGIPIKYIRYKYQSHPKQLMVGDIFIAPRDLRDSYNLAHTFTKIGYPMALGILVIASPVPSYLNSPAILSENDQDWKRNLIKLFSNQALLTELSKKGIDYVKKNYSPPVIKCKYYNFFRELLK